MVEIKERNYEPYKCTPHFSKRKLIRSPTKEELLNNKFLKYKYEVPYSGVFDSIDLKNIIERIVFPDVVSIGYLDEDVCMAIIYKANNHLVEDIQGGATL